MNIGLGMQESKQVEGILLQKKRWHTLFQIQLISPCFT